MTRVTWRGNKQMEEDLAITAGLQLEQPKDESFLASKFHWPRNERPKWLLVLMSGTIALYITRIIMPLCVVSLAEEIHWDKRQSVSLFATFYVDLYLIYYVNLIFVPLICCDCLCMYMQL